MNLAARATARSRTSHEDELPAAGRGRATAGAVLFWGVWAAVVAMILGVGGVYPMEYLAVDALLAVMFMVGVAQGVVALGKGGWGWFDGAVLACLCIPLLQLISGHTIDRAATENCFLQLLGAAMTFWMLRQSLTSIYERRLVQIHRGLSLAAGALALEAIVQLQLTPQEIFGVYHVTVALPMGPFVNRDDFGLMMEMLLPFALLQAMAASRASRRWLGAGAAALVVAAVALSASLGGMLMCTAEVVAVGAWAAYQRQHTRSGRQHRRGSESMEHAQLAASPSAMQHHRKRGRSHPRRTGGLAAMVATPLVILVALYLVKPANLMYRLQHPAASLESRLGFIHAAFAIALAHPVWGVGLGAFKDAYPRFGQINSILLYAHSDYAQWLSETGLLGALGGAAVAGLYLSRAFRWRPEKVFTLASQTALLSVGVHAMLDFPFHIPGLALLYTALAALLATAQSERVKPVILQ